MHKPRHLSRGATLFAAACILSLCHTTSSAALPAYAEQWLPASNPEEVEVDPFGRVWVSCDDDMVHVYAPTGGVELFSFGGTGGGDGQFYTPYGIAFDPSGNAYICDYAGARLQKFASDGTFLLAWSIPSTNADHVAVDAAGDVYVTGYTDYSVHKYTSNGMPLLDWVGPPEATNSGVVVVGNVIYVVEWDAPSVEQYDLDGTYLGSFDASTLGGTDIELDSDGQLWVCDHNHNVVRVFAQDGTPIDILGSYGSGPGEFSLPIGVAQGLDGSIYVADYGNGRVQRFGEPTASVGALGTSITQPQVLSLAPNPCRSSSTLTYALPENDEVAVTLHDVSGRLVSTLTSGHGIAGVHTLSLAPRAADGRPLGAGTYFVRVAGARGESNARLVVVR